MRCSAASTVRSFRRSIAAASPLAPRALSSSCRCRRYTTRCVLRVLGISRASLSRLIRAYNSRSPRRKFKSGAASYFPFMCCGASLPELSESSDPSEPSFRAFVRFLFFFFGVERCFYFTKPLSTLSSSLCCANFCARY